MDLHIYYTYKDGVLYNKAGHAYRNTDKDGYLRIRRGGHEYRGHRIIWEMFNGPIPEGLFIDHIDGDVTNNKIENLRACTRQQNNANSKKKGDSSLPKGVTRDSNRYRARISHKGTTYSLGTFASPEEASNAYMAKAIELNGEFARG